MKTILVVDDNKLNLTSARKVLNDKYKVIPVMRGQQALTYLENGECDVILLDINMPEMDGFEVLKRIREMERCRNIPVIFLTADDDAGTEIRCFKAGAADFIAKPFVPEIMLSRIGRIIELEDLRRSLADRLEQKTREVSDIKSKSNQDALTGLWNRVYTEEKVNEMLGRGTEGALMMMDLDNFKSINDNYGHMAGDKVLQLVADVLRESSSEGDVPCRLGGDEFIVFVKGVTSKAELGNRAARIISEFDSKIKECGFETNTSVSVGIAQTMEGRTEFPTLYSSADKALYHVKQNGKNDYHFFGDKLQAESDRGKKMVDLKYLLDLMRRADSGKGPYLLDFESFHHVYNVIYRQVDRSSTDIQTLLFTITVNENARLDAGEDDLVIELLEEAACTSLQRSDVLTRYSGKQLFIILVGTDSENGEAVAGRIIEEFGRLDTTGKVHIDYTIARMDS